jgi:hypothetical protein
MESSLVFHKYQEQNLKVRFSCVSMDICCVQRSDKLEEVNKITYVL